ncbi:MAG: hypothetical protein GQ549_01585, partial [Gammaproteobacteria bacterium]|nr:hypothetical protein [Gammaproteobacteria bacterium]
DILLKLENTAQYPGIIELEELGLAIHQDAGFEVPEHWPVKVKGLQALAIKRFDRSANGNTVFMESLYSVLASGSGKITSNYSTTYDHIGQAIDNPVIQLVTDRKAAKTHLLKRLILAMLTGNGDLHLENLSLIEDRGKLCFSPVYDPVPMRAYSIHNALVPPGMGFGDYGDVINDKFIDFETAMIRFSKNLGINKTALLNIIEPLLKVSDDYDKKINALKTLPKDNKNNLIKIHQQMRNKFEAL